MAPRSTFFFPWGLILKEKIASKSHPRCRWVVSRCASKPFRRTLSTLHAAGGEDWPNLFRPHIACVTRNRIPLQVQRQQLFTWGPPYLPTDGGTKWRWLDVGTMDKHPNIDPRVSRSYCQRCKKPPFVFSSLWKPKTAWRVVVDASTDPEGWCYSVSWSNRKWTRDEGLLDYVRRRKWVRDFT